MRSHGSCYTVICRHHFNQDACEPWSNFVVIVEGVSDASQAAIAACSRLVKDHGGMAEANIVINGNPELSLPEANIIDSMQDVWGRDWEKVSSYRELN